MVYTSRIRGNADRRPQAFWGAFIPAAINFVGGLITSSQQAKAQKRALEEQQRLAQQQLNISNQNQLASTLNNYANAQQSYDDKDYNLKYRIGGVKRLGGRNIMITDGGNAKRIGNNTYLLRGGSHEDINETGQTGIGINVGGNEIEAEGGEVAQRKGNSLRIYSAQPILGGMSPAQAIMRGYNKDKVFNAQQKFKKNNGIKDDGSQQRIGGEVPYNHYDPTGLFGGSPHPLAKMIDITGITSYGDVKKLINKKRRGEIPTTQEYLGALSAIPGIGRIAKALNLIGNVADATTFMKDVKESEAKEKAYQNEVVKYMDIHGRIKTGRRGSMPYSAHELRKRYGGLTSKDRGSSKHPYPSVASKDFAGGNRSYPIPTKADAIDALRLAGLHGRSDVRSKVYSKYPELRKKAAIGTSIGINSYNTNIPDYTSTYINWLISQLPSKQDTSVTKYNQEDINNAINAANIAYQNYLIRQLPSGKSNKQEDNRQGNNISTRYITADELKRNTQSLVDSSRRSVDFANNTYRSKLISQLQPEDKRSLKDKTQSMIDAAQFAVNNAINYRNSKLISQLPSKQDSKENNKKEKNKVVKRQVRTTPQYTGNTTKGNYQLHDGETKVINGVKYTRRGNTIINHKTNVGYIYDKNGNYTGQADYSKVGNFNQAFDAARAAGRNQFIYRAGKYNNYSTVKETNAKKERLNRIVGARRIAKKMGGLTNPPVGSRKKYLPGGTANPWDEYRFSNYPTPNTWNERYGISNVPDYGGTAPWQVSNKYAVNVPHPISKFDLPITTITAKKDTFNDEMSRRMRAGVQNLKDSSDNTTVPYLGKQSSFSPKVQDYIGLGVDTLAALGSGIFTRSAYNKMNFDYALPNYVDESPVAFDTTYHNEAQRANVERNRLNTRGLITGNTSSAQTALNLMQKTDTDAMMETNKLLDEKSNKEVELRNQNLANEQQVRARNAAARNQYYQNVAQIRNAALEAKNNMELAKAQSIGTDLSGLSQAYSNFANSVENRYNTRQNEAIIAATAKDPAVLSNAVQFGYNFSPEVLAAIYNSTNDDALKNLALSQLNSKNRRKYGIK